LLEGKKIILAITGSIAAYKTPQLARLLVKAGAEVQIIMTEAAKDFVTPLALATVSKRPVFDAVANGDHWNNHVHLGRWADALLIAPCSAHTLARMAHGICDNMVQAVYLSANCPVIVAPAMDEDMWLHPSTKANVHTITSYGNHIIPVATGELASGIFGAGRMAEPEEIVAYLDNFWSNSSSETIVQNHVAFEPKYKGKKALVTAGPTYEMIDPVRFIGNFSSGKMGTAIAEALANKGFEVYLIAGPGVQVPDQPNIHIEKVMSAQNMFDKCVQHFSSCDIAVMAAAVADFRPAIQANEKIKKGAADSMSIELIKNPDILKHLGSIKNSTQILVGFALETNNERQNALTKLQSKNADFIALNSLNDPGAGFEHDTNKITLIAKDSRSWDLPLQSKKEVARQLVDLVLEN
jgi:phosphopantothenoylcysteine decarboxylase/phosphopantothenate--cysteine ligase